MAPEITISPLSDGASLADVVDAVRRVLPDVPRRQAALMARHCRREVDLTARDTDAQRIAARTIERLRRRGAAGDVDVAVDFQETSSLRAAAG